MLLLPCEWKPAVVAKASRAMNCILMEGRRRGEEGEGERGGEGGKKERE